MRNPKNLCAINFAPTTKIEEMNNSHAEPFRRDIRELKVGLKEVEQRYGKREREDRKEHQSPERNIAFEQCKSISNIGNAAFGLVLFRFALWRMSDFSYNKVTVIAAARSTEKLAELARESKGL